MKIIKILILSILLLSVNLMSNDIATVTALKGSALIEREVESIEAFVGAKLKQKDIIKTNEDSKLQIIFQDETIITIGKNSNFSIQEYLFEDSKTPVARFNILKGAMKTITGKIGKIAPQKFSVKAKTSTIGIRGTNFIVVVKNDNSYQAYCTYGAISVSIGAEVYIVKQGFFINVSADGKTELKKFTPKELNDMEKSNFGKDKTYKEDNALDDETIDDADLDITFDENSDIMIQDISDTLSDMDRIIIEENNVPQDSPGNDNFNSPSGNFSP